MLEKGPYLWWRLYDRSQKYFVFKYIYFFTEEVWTKLLNILKILQQNIHSIFILDQVSPYSNAWRQQTEKLISSLSNSFSSLLHWLDHILSGVPVSLKSPGFHFKIMPCTPYLQTIYIPPV